MYDKTAALMAQKLYEPVSLLDTWVQENNNLVNKGKQQEKGMTAWSQDQSSLKCLSSEFHKLLMKIQGVPPLPDHTQLELTVTYNACVYSVALSQFSEAELLLTQAIERVFQRSGEKPVSSDPPVIWRKIMTSLKDTDLHVFIHWLLCVQWAIWLATCRLKMIQELQEDMCSVFDSLNTEVHNDRWRKGKSPDTPLLVLDPRKLVELLRVCTLIAQGAEKLSEGESSEALNDLQNASSLPAPRTLVAYTHLLSGSCFAHMSHPHMALQCYRKALEIDSHCVCALYQSMLVYRQLKNTTAEIQALRLLHSALMLLSATEPVIAGTHLLSPSLLLRSQSLSSLLSVPSALSVLHSLALKCVLYGRVSEGVENYLDLLAVLQTEDQHQVSSEALPLPRLPELYLEAGSALLMIQRPGDCITLCEEVINKTQDLLPERVVLEEPEQKDEAKNVDVCAEHEDKVKMLLWSGAAYLLQGHCHTHLKDWKEAITHYTRCMNLLVKVFFKKTGCQPQILSADIVDNQGTDLCVLQRLKGLSLCGRGICFIQTNQLREALRDLQLSLQAFPECVGAGLWCGEVLWRLGRREEAAACWENTWSFTTQSTTESIRLYSQEPQTGPLLDSTEIRQRIQGLIPT